MTTVVAKTISGRRQRGAVLIIALVFLLLITVVATTSVRFGALELLMSGNTQARMEALQLANGISYGVIDKWQQNFVTDRILCGTKGSITPDLRCDEDSLVLPGSNSISCDPASPDNLNEYLEYLACANVADAKAHYLTQYLGETTATNASVSAIAFNFQLESVFDATASKQGKSETVMGVQIINPVAGQFGVSPEGNIDSYVHIPGD